MRVTVCELEGNLDQLEIALRASDATLCLTTALSHHDLTDVIPPEIDLALPRSRRRFPEMLRYDLDPRNSANHRRPVDGVEPEAVGLANSDRPGSPRLLDQAVPTERMLESSPRSVIARIRFCS